MDKVLIGVIVRLRAALAEVFMEKIMNPSGAGEGGGGVTEDGGGGGGVEGCVEGEGGGEGGEVTKRLNAVLHMIELYVVDGQ